MLSGLSVVLLAYNEEKNLPKAVSSAVSAAGSVARAYEVIIVCYEGSTDGTLKVARAMSAKNSRIRIVTQPVSQGGYGIALRMGLQAAKREYVFYTDADNQFDLAELSRLVPYAKDYDIVSGYRRKRKDPLGRILSAKVYNLVLRILFGLRVRDVDSAFKLYRKTVIERIKIRSRTGLVDAEILIKAKNAGLRLKEVPVHHFPRTIGRSNYGSGFVKPSVVINLFKEMRAIWNDLKGEHS